MIRGAILALLAALLASPAFAQLLEFSDAEFRRILQHGPWPAPWTPDPSNRVSGSPAAIEWGERLFFERRLSRGGGVLCSTCHVPYRGWQDGLERGRGLGISDRNTPALLNVRHLRWFGWDGANDSLWAQSIRPILDPLEMGLSMAEVGKLVRGDREHACRYERAFGKPPPPDDEAIMVAVGKALAAFQETLVSGRTPFDEFRDALSRGDRTAAARYPVAAQKGLRIFVGKGNCNLCHLGPAFTNGEFHDVGIPFFVAPGKVDPGRHGGIRKLLDSAFNLLGRHSDDASRASGTRTRHVVLEHRNFGEFKVPGLRNVAMTAPYAHHGSLATLEAVVRHYSTVSPDRLHSDGEAIVRALNLDAEEVSNLVAFLESLTETASALPARRPVAPCER